MELELPAHGELIGHEPLLQLLSALMGPDFVFHHLHSDRQRPDVPGKPWHHDYEQRPQTDRAHAMIHTLHYLDGLDAGTSSLVVLPGSHLEVAEKDASAGQRGKDRYFVDASYCEVGPAWLPVKPYWRHLLRRAQELGLDHGTWPELFAERHFAEYVRPA
ncbi:hypothetical protein JHN63_45520 [Streptomyces sp. MBT65]|nr:hypothetical protein [Streptomyces sp. MBT65]